MSVASLLAARGQSGRYTGRIRAISKGVVIGDSTMAVWPTGVGINSVGYYLFEPEELVAGCSIANIAVPGETINQQLGHWNALANKSTYLWVYNQIGLNDVDPTEAASVAIARMQALIDQQIADVPNIVIIVGKMIPCRQRLIDVFGATDGVISQQKVLDMNSAYMGQGPNALTGVDFYVSAHFNEMSDGSGNLRADLDTGDHIHDNNFGKVINARHIRETLATAGF